MSYKCTLHASTHLVPLANLRLVSRGSVQSRRHEPFSALACFSRSSLTNLPIRKLHGSRFLGIDPAGSSQNPHKSHSIHHPRWGLFTKFNIIIMCFMICWNWLSTPNLTSELTILFPKWRITQQQRSVEIRPDRIAPLEPTLWDSHHTFLSQCLGSASLVFIDRWPPIVTESAMIASLHYTVNNSRCPVGNSFITLSDSYAEEKTRWRQDAHSNLSLNHSFQIERDQWLPFTLEVCTISSWLSNWTWLDTSAHLRWPPLLPRFIHYHLPLDLCSKYA